MHFATRYPSTCSSDVRFTATSQGQYPTGGYVTFRWYTAISGGSPFHSVTVYETSPNSQVWTSAYTNNSNPTGDVTYYVSMAYHNDSPYYDCTESLRRTVTWTYTSATSGNLSIGLTSAQSPYPSVPPFLCVGDGIRLSPQGGSGYSWSSSPYDANASGSGMITVSPTVTTTYTLYGTESTCGQSKSASVTVTVAPKVGQVSAPAGPSALCQGVTSSTYTSNAPSNVSSYQWELLNPTNGTGLYSAASSMNSSIVGGIPTLAITWSPSFTGTVRVKLNAFSASGCNYSTSAYTDVTITPTPGPPTVSNVSTLFGSQVTLSATGAGPNESYKWYNSSGTQVSNTINTSSLSNPTTTYYVSRYSTTNTACETASGQRAAQTVSLYLNAPPPASVSLNTCGPKTATMPAAPSLVVYMWEGNNPSGELIQPMNPTYTFNSNGPHYIRAKASTMNLWSPATTVSASSTQVDPVDATISAYDPANPIVQATHSITIVPGFTAPSGSTFVAKIAITSECNDFVNWTENVVYDANAQPISAGKSYFDGFGDGLLSESKDYLTKKVFAAKPLYNTYGAQVANTLSAPILEHDFIYKNNFVRNEANQIYSPADFDLRTTTNTPGEINNPKPVGEQPGTLGWYYSTNNNLEPLTPVTDFPYSRGYTPEGPDPTTSKSAGVGAAHRMGTGREVISERQLIASADMTHYLQIRPHFVASSLEVKGYKNIVTDPDGKKNVAFTDADGRTLMTATLDANNNLDNRSYNFYNDLGQLVATVAPKGVNTGSSAMPEFVTRYTYDHLGRTIQVTSPDEGTSRMVYSNDGKIRFSQSQKQFLASPQRFSYTNYDKLGRTIESGEYISKPNGYVFQPQDGTTTITNSILPIVDEIGQTTGISKKISGQAPNITDHTYIDYDLQAVDFPDAAITSQQNINGQISRTENANSITWYSYDEFGQLSKSWQQIKVTNPIVVKTIDYTYDYFGNVTEVAYQRNNTNDRFFHHYVYDGNQRLSETYTSKDGVNKTLHAKYYYYLHGPLKRIVLGNNVQGIDYTYTIDGSLKAINHSDPSKDPGGDAADIFGEVLNYYDGDFQGAGYSAGSQSITGFTNQYSGLVKGISYHSPADNHQKRTYAYEYDSRNQLTNAIWGSMTGSSGSYGFSQAQSETFREGVTGYDKNGNIQALIRKGRTGNNLANYTYVYEANTNKLDKVNHHNGTQLIELIDYDYNAIGQMVTKTENSKTLTYHYNAYGLIRQVKDSSQSPVKVVQTYTYDDRGNLLQKVSYSSAGVPEKYTTYVNDVSGNVMAIYEQTGTTTLTATQSEVPVYASGRVAVYKPSVNRYFYEVSDHLGNVRGVIGGPETLVYTATMEDNGLANYTNPRVQELAVFKNLAVTEKQDANMNHTASSTAMPIPVYSSYLRWVSGQSGSTVTQSVGPAIGLKVEPGDVIDMEVWGKFEKVGTSYSRAAIVSTVAGILGSNFVGSAAGIDVIGKATQVFNNGFAEAVSAATGNGNDGTTAPFAYLYYILYDRSFNPITTGSARMPSTAGYDPATELPSKPHQLISIPTRNITEPGYIYIFVANESEGIKVWFDDLKVTHQRSNVVAGADYYPFGLPMENREITREPYRFGYQGQYSEKDATTGQNEFELRFYDAKIARWLSADPFGQFYSPYVAMGNVPQLFTDPDGGLCCGGEKIAFEVTSEAVEFAMKSAPVSITNHVVTSAALRALFTRGPWTGPTYIDERSWFYKNVLEPATDNVHGMLRSFIRGLAPTFYSGNSNKVRDREHGEKYFGPLAQLAFNPSALYNNPPTSLVTPGGTTVTTNVTVDIMPVFRVHMNGSSPGYRDVIEEHHLLPQTFKKFFERAGLDIEKFKIPLTRARHRLKPDGVHTTGGGNWVKRWETWISQNPNATKDQILEFLATLRAEFGI